MGLKVLFPLIQLYLLLVPSSVRAVNTTVDLGYATYEGVALSNGINQYLGMRFAAPPLGDLRFRAPEPPLNYTGVQNASQHGPLCLATISATDGPAGPDAGQSEDCLFIDVFAPSNTTTLSKLPVYLWITGGGYTQEANADYNGSTLVQASKYDMIVITFNYRVGPFGFLAGKDVQANGALNTGLLDQRMAFQWVQQHIDKFGGDPEHVVLDGCSSGAGSVALHLTAYGGRNDGYFIGAIGDSVFFPRQPRVSELEFQFQAFANMSGCGNATDTMACLRSQDTDTLQSANVPLPYPGRTEVPLFYWTPCIDGDLIRDFPYLEFEKGNFIHVPILFGNDNNEGSIFAPNASSAAEIASFFSDNYPGLSDNDTAAINRQYPLGLPTRDHNAYFSAASAAYGESTFVCPGNLICESYSCSFNASRVWNYRYNVLDPANVALGLGVPHIWQTAAVWGPGGTPGYADTAYTTINAEIVPIVMQYWISFVKNLDPNIERADCAPIWQPFGSNKSRLLLQTNHTQMESVPANQTQRCTFWRGLAPTMEQ